MGPSAGAINLVGGTDQGHGLIDRANFSPFKMANRRPARFTERAQRPPVHHQLNGALGEASPAQPCASPRVGSVFNPFGVLEHRTG
jgi:hypothetical protein